MSFSAWCLPKTFPDPLLAKDLGVLARPLACEKCRCVVGSAEVVDRMVQATLEMTRGMHQSAIRDWVRPGETEDWIVRINHCPTCIRKVDGNWPQILLTLKIVDVIYVVPLASGTAEGW